MLFVKIEINKLAKVATGGLHTPCLQRSEEKVFARGQNEQLILER